MCVCVCAAVRSKDGVSYSAGVSVEDEGDVVVVKTAASGEGGVRRKMMGGEVWLGVRVGVGRR